MNSKNVAYFGVQLKYRKLFQRYVLRGAQLNEPQFAENEALLATCNSTTLIAVVATDLGLTVSMSMEDKTDCDWQSGNQSYRR